MSLRGRARIMPAIVRLHTGRRRKCSVHVSPSLQRGHVILNHGILRGHYCQHAACYSTRILSCSRPEKCHAPSAEVYGNIEEVHLARRVKTVTPKRFVEGEYAVEGNGRRSERMKFFEAQVTAGKGE